MSLFLRCVALVCWLLEAYIHGGPVPMQSTSGADKMVMPKNLNVREKRAAPEDQCGYGWIEYGSSCYLYVDQKVYQISAQYACELLNAKLLEVESIAENDFVKQNVTGPHGDSPIWLGMNDRETEGVFMWEKPKRSATFTNWHDGEPNDAAKVEECVQMTCALTHGEWNDVPCDVAARYVCQRSAA